MTTTTAVPSWRKKVQHLNFVAAAAETRCKRICKKGRRKEAGGVESAKASKFNGHTSNTSTKNISLLGIEGDNTLSYIYK